MSAAGVTGCWVPQGILALRELSRFERELLAKVTLLARETGFCTADDQWLADALECSRRHVRRGFASLAKHDLVTFEVSPRRGVKGGRRRLSRPTEKTIAALSAKCGPESPNLSTGADRRVLTSASKCGPESPNKGACGADSRVPSHEESSGRVAAGKEYSAAREPSSDGFTPIQVVLPAPTGGPEVTPHACSCDPAEGDSAAAALSQSKGTPDPVRESGRKGGQTSSQSPANPQAGGRQDPENRASLEKATLHTTAREESALTPQEQEIALRLRALGVCSPYPPESLARMRPPEKIFALIDRWRKGGGKTEAETQAMSEAEFTAWEERGGKRIRWLVTAIRNDYDAKVTIEKRRSLVHAGRPLDDAERAARELRQAQKERLRRPPEEQQRLDAQWAAMRDALARQLKPCETAPCPGGHP